MILGMTVIFLQSALIILTMHWGASPWHTFVFALGVALMNILSFYEGLYR